MGAGLGGGSGHSADMETSGGTGRGASTQLEVGLSPRLAASHAEPLQRTVSTQLAITQARRQRCFISPSPGLPACQSLSELSQADAGVLASTMRAFGGLLLTQLHFRAFSTGVFARYY